ncbi:predicted protein, partial [Nematostella vectensis]
IDMELDCNGAGRDVWLVKVPKYLSNLWMEKADPSGIVGTLKINKDQVGKKEKIVFFFASFRELEILKKKILPGDKECGLSIALFYGSNKFFNYYYTSEKLAVEGRVVQRADCRPLNPSNDYFLHKRKSIQVASKPARQAQQLKKIVTNAYKPVSDHKMNIEYKKKKKDEGKRARATEEDVKASLFSAFEQHQYYNLKDLVHKTQQPIVYLKSILKEIAQYNTKNPHKNMWELKPEYRHYGKNTEDKDSS